MLQTHFPLTLSVPSKILESCISDNVKECKQLMERQWAHHKGNSTLLLLAHFTECWRQAVDNNFMVVTAFTDFRKASDRVSHTIQIKSLYIVSFVDLVSLLGRSQDLCLCSGLRSGSGCPALCLLAYSPVTVCPWLLMTLL